jgi:hypothetical protein
MKRVFLFLLFAVTSVRAAEIALLDGRVLHHANVSKFNGAEFVIEHDGGMAHVPWAQMSADWQSKYPLNPARAAKMDKIDRELRELRTEATQRIETAQNAERKRRQLNVRPIQEVASDLPAFNAKQVSFEGTISVSDYYNYGFSKAAASTYSFEVRDATGRMHVYIRREEAKALRDELLAAGKPLRGIVSCVVYEGMCGPLDLLAEGIGFYKPVTPGQRRVASRRHSANRRTWPGTASIDDAA